MVAGGPSGTLPPAGQETIRWRQLRESYLTRRVLWGKDAEGCRRIELTT